MQEVRRVLRKAAYRLFILDLFRTLVIAVSAGLSALIVLRFVQQIFGLSITGTDWWRAADR